MKRRLSIIVVAFCISFALMIMLSFFSMERFSTFSRFSDQVDHSGRVIMNIRSADVSLRDMALSERGYMITRDTMYLRFFNGAVDSIAHTLDTLKQLTSDNAEQQNILAVLKGSVALRIRAARENIDYVDSSRSSERSKFYDSSRSLLRECSQRLRAMRMVENRLLDMRAKNERFYQRLTNDTLKYLLMVFCVITLILFALMVKELRGRMLFQEQLQTKVIDLGRSHNELQEIAYAASHDLQEPLRKIQVFCDLLTSQKNLGDSEKRETLERINRSANRMQLLITDLLSLTSLTNIDEEKVTVDLNRLVFSLLNEMHSRVSSTGASVEVQSLPSISGYDTQLKILFKALIDNSLKFSREGVKPVVTITCEAVPGAELAEFNSRLAGRRFLKITFADNGIGFDNQYIDKIFKLFQRLHAPDSEYAGKGIGLAICKRIMANHEGYIIGRGVPQVGAQFILYFPGQS